MRLNRSYIITIWVALFITSYPFHVISQTHGTFTQMVTIEAENTTLEEIFAEVTKQTGFKFSYNPSKVNALKRVDYQAINKSLQHVLDDLLLPDYSYNLRGEYLVLVPKVNEPSQKEDFISISGRILDNETKVGLPQTSIFTSSGKSSVSTLGGNFEIEIKNSDKPILEIRKEGFHPSSIEIERKNTSDLEFYLRPIKHLSLQLSKDSFDLIESSKPQTKEISTLFRIHPELKVNQNNINDTIYKPVSFSFYPGIATYGKLSGSIIFNLAINMVGFNRGINGLELGAISNINKENVRGFQAGGVSNYTGGNVNGLQLSGVFNKVSGKVMGTSMSGVLNIVNDTLIGVQMAGVSNYNGSHSEGLQAAGVFNNTSTLNGIQLSGVVNASHNIRGVQVSGVVGKTDTIHGVQLSGVTNIADHVKGGQISSIYNKASRVEGIQLALFNSADSMVGLPIGLLSFVHKNGYKRLGVYYDEVFPLNISFKTGVNYFYNHVFAGSHLDLSEDSDALWTVGYGLGSSLPIANRFYLDFGLSGQYVTKREFVEDVSVLFKGYLGLEVGITENIRIAAGATYNAYALANDLDSDLALSNIFSDYNNIYYENNLTWRTWSGFRVGLRYAI